MYTPSRKCNEYENGTAEPIIKGRLKSALPYWRDVIKAPHSVLSIIEKGFMLDFITKPPNMYFKNNSFKFSFLRQEQEVFL